MAIPTFEDKEDARQTELPRKYTLVADDVNQIKRSIEYLYNNPPVVNPTLNDVLNEGNESPTSLKIVGTGTAASLVAITGISTLDSSNMQTFAVDSQNGAITGGSLGVLGTIYNENGIVKPYKELMYILDADDAGNDPNYLKGINDFSETDDPVFLRSTLGLYTVNQAGAFAGMTHCDLSIQRNGVSNEKTTSSYRFDDDAVYLEIMDASGNRIDGFVGTLYIKVIPNP